MAEVMTTCPPYSSAAASWGAPAGSPVRAARSVRRSRYPVTTAVPPSPSAPSRAATACSVAMDASTNDARSARSSTGYPVSIISGNTTTRAPRSAARRVHATISSAFPSRSPTVALTCASAILSFVTLPA